MSKTDESEGRNTARITMANWKNGITTTVFGASLLFGLSGCGKKDESVLSQQSEAEAAYSQTNWVLDSFEPCVARFHQEYLSGASENEPKRRFMYQMGIWGCEGIEENRQRWGDRDANATSGTEHATRLYACLRVASDRVQAREITEDEGHDRMLKCSAEAHN